MEQIELASGAELPQFVKDEFDAFLECGILAHGFLRLRCGACGHDKLVASHSLIEESSWSSEPRGAAPPNGRRLLLSSKRILRLRRRSAIDSACIG
jgi:hypothetical protein